MDNSPVDPWQLACNARAPGNSNPQLEDNHTADTGKPIPDNQYYFDLVVFKVGNVIFRVPKVGFIVPGTIFEAMFSLPATGEGLNDENPIDLPVNEETFRGFLRSMYPFNGLSIEPADWLATLELSTLWMFDEMRNRAIHALDPWITNQNAKEVVLLAKKYRNVKWLKIGYTRLLEERSLSAAELSATPSLDWETIAKLLSAKLLNTRGCNHPCRSCPPVQVAFHGSSSVTQPVQMNLLSAMEQEFGDEFSDMQKWPEGSIDSAPELP